MTINTMRWARWLIPVIAVPLAIACGSDDSEEDGSGGSSGSGGGQKRDTGSACTDGAQCFGGLCLTNKTFAELTENDAEAEIPGGYCSLLVCPKNQAEGACGPGGYCFDLEQFVETPLTACFDVCESDSDCRQSEGYICTDVSGSQWTPLPKKACLPPSLLCLLEVPQPSCPDVGADAGAGGSDAGTAGSAGAAGSG